MRGCPEFPTNISARTARPARPGAGSSMPSPRCRRPNRAALRLRRPASARSRRHLSRARRDRRPAVAAQPSAAHHRRGRLAATDRRHRAARAIARNGAARSLWRGPAGRRRRGACGRDCRQQRISARGLRHQTARRPLSSPLCRRCRPRPRRALVGAERPHPGAVGRRLRAGKSPGAVARLFQSLQVDECRARGAVLRGVPRQSCAPAPTATSRASAC